MSSLAQLTTAVVSGIVKQVSLGHSLFSKNLPTSLYLSRQMCSEELELDGFQSTDEETHTRQQGVSWGKKLHVTCSGRPERDNGPLEWGMGGLGSCELGLLGTSRSESKECPGKGLGQAACDSTQAEAGEGKVSA